MHFFCNSIKNWIKLREMDFSYDVFKKYVKCNFFNEDLLHF